jgi:serine protease Do
MKTRYILGSLFMALFGASVALFAYTKLIEKPAVVIPKDTSDIDVQNAKALLTSLQMNEGQVDFTYAAEQTVHAVVHVHTKSLVGMQPDNPIMEFFYGDRYSRPREREANGYGSGVIISGDGYIITNNHVVENAESVDVTLNDKRTFDAKVVGRDQSTDVALLKINAENLPYIKYGDSDQLKLGEWVLAVGNPFNLTSTVTAGIVSAKGRGNLNLIEGDYSIESFIQTDAALNVGNSGGALVNTKGLLVGITSAIYSPNGAYAGNSFAIPVTIVRKVVNDLKEYGEVQRAVIGVKIKDIEQKDADKLKLADLKGALITDIIQNGSAQDAGLKENDVIVRFDGREISSVTELREQAGRHRPGDRVSLTYIRNGKENSAALVMKNIAGNTNVVTPDMGGEEIFGARMAPLGSSDMRSMNVDYGVKVIDIKDGRFKDLGIKRGYVILNVNGKKVKSPGEVRQYTSDGKTLKSIGGIQTDGTIFNYQFGN